MSCIGRRGGNGILHLRRDARNVGGGCQRNIRNRKPRFLRVVRPSHNVGQRNIVLQLHVGWGHDRLRAVIRFPRKRNDRLRSRFRIGLLGSRCFLTTSIERRKIFRRLVIDYLGVVEHRLGNDLRLKRKEARESDQQCKRDYMKTARLNETGPGKRTLHEYVGPEGRGRRAKLKRWKPRRKNQVTQITEEDARPRRQFDQKPQIGRGLRDCVESLNRAHRTYTRCADGTWDSRKGMIAADFRVQSGTRRDPTAGARKSLTRKNVYNLVFRHSAAFSLLRTHFARFFRRFTTNSYVRDAARVGRRQKSRAHGMGEQATRPWEPALH